MPEISMIFDITPVESKKITINISFLIFYAGDGEKERTKIIYSKVCSSLQPR